MSSETLETTCPRHHSRGFTIVELAIVIFFIILIFGIAVTFFVMSVRTATYIRQRSDVTYSAEEAIERMIDEIRGNSELLLAEPESISFRLKGETISYSFDPETNTIFRNQRPHVRGVELFLLQYLDEDGIETSILADVQRVVVTVKGQSGSEELDISTTVGFRTR